MEFSRNGFWPLRKPLCREILDSGVSSRVAFTTNTLGLTTTYAGSVHAYINHTDLGG